MRAYIKDKLEFFNDYEDLIRHIKLDYSEDVAELLQELLDERDGLIEEVYELEQELNEVDNE